MTERLHPGIERCNLAQHALSQLDRREVGNAASKLVLGIRAAVDVLEKKVRQSPTRQFAEIGARDSRYRDR